MRNEVDIGSRLELVEYVKCAHCDGTGLPMSEDFRSGHGACPKCYGVGIWKKGDPPTLPDNIHEHPTQIIACDSCGGTRGIDNETKMPCYCGGTGLLSISRGPIAHHVMDAIKFIPCTTCNGTGHILAEGKICNCFVCYGNGMVLPDGGT